MAKNLWRVYYGTEENIFECEHEDFTTLAEAQAWVKENVKNDIKSSYEKVGEKIGESELDNLVSESIKGEHKADTGGITDEIGEYRYVYSIGEIGKTCRQARKFVDELRSEYKFMFF